jgi:hypothetical protein
LVSVFHGSWFLEEEEGGSEGVTGHRSKVRKMEKRRG